jgi:glucose-6-phosphate 1-dehydrogenase
MKLPEDLALIIFGASGDLTYRKLIPALYSLRVQRLLPGIFEIIGASRSKISDDDFRKKMREGIISFSGEKNIDDINLSEFTQHLSYFSIDFSSPDDYESLRKYLISKDQCT